MASLNTSYVDNIVSDEDKTDALQALMQVFKSMVYVTFRISVGAVTARKSIHIEDLALKKKNENKLLVQTTLNPTLFLGSILTFFTQVQKVCVLLKTRSTRQVQSRGMVHPLASVLQGKERDKSASTSEPEEHPLQRRERLPRKRPLEKKDGISVRKFPSDVQLITLNKIVRGYGGSIKDSAQLAKIS